MLRTRVLTAAVALPIVLVLILFAPNWLFTAFIGAVTAWELYEVATMAHPRRSVLILCLIGLGAVPAIALVSSASPRWAWPVIVMAMMLLLAGAVAAKGGPETCSRVGSWLLPISALYVGVLIPYFALLRNRPGGISLIFLMLLIAIASDTGAYFAGRAFGRRKLLPKVSPNKTIEGAIGGLAASVLAGFILRPWLIADWPIGKTAAIAAAIGVLAQLGDLSGSALKRVAGVKDSGWLLPGHGGLIDRTCSLVFAAVFTYYVA